MDTTHSDKLVEHILKGNDDDANRMLLQCTIKAQERFLTRKIELYYEDKFYEDPDALKNILPAYIIDHFKQKSQNDVKSNAFHLTLCPPEDDIDDLFDTVGTLLKKRPWMESPLYAFEQRSETEDDMGRGLHCHMYFEADKPKSHVLREIKSAVPKIVLKLQQITKGTESQVIKYIKGEKEEAKSLKTQIDKIWREAENIEPFYQVRDPYDLAE